MSNCLLCHFFVLKFCFEKTGCLTFQMIGRDVVSNQNVATNQEKSKIQIKANLIPSFLPRETTSQKSGHETRSEGQFTVGILNFFFFFFKIFFQNLVSH